MIKRGPRSLRRSMEKAGNLIPKPKRCAVVCSGDKKKMSNREKLRHEAYHK